MIVNKSMFPLQTGFSVISKMQSRFGDLQMQLGTGQKSNTLAGMGRDLPISVSVRSRLASIEGYSGNIAAVNLRLSFYEPIMERFDKIEAEARTSATPSGYGTGDINMATLPKLSLARFDEIVTLLNSDIDGRHIFGGSVTDVPPLPTAGALLDGEGGRAGFRTIVMERKAADTGIDGRGRVDVGGSIGSTNVTLTEDGVHRFGFKLSTLSTTSSGIAPTAPTGDPSADPPTPRSRGIDVVAQPVVGQTITFGFMLPDETETQITLTAAAAPADGNGQFEIGADEAATAANIRAALAKALEREAGTTLSAASTFAAAKDFFAGPGETAQRVSGDPLGAATALVDADPATTLTWYRGESTETGNPRQSVSAQVDETTRVNYGVQASESGLLALVRTMAAMTVEDYPPADATSHGRFDAMATRQQAAMSEAHNSKAGSVEMITMELGIALSTANQAAARHTSYTAQLQDLLSEAETVSKEDVAMELLALQTRLTASYQATSMVSQLSLVNFL